MKKIVGYFIVVCFIYLVTGSAVFSQTKIDTVYIKYPGAIKHTTKDSASYYRVRTISKDTLKAEDYRIQDNTIACSGYYKTFDPYINNGFFVFYSTLIYGSFPAGRSEGNYLNDEKDGIWKYYYPSGELLYSETYIKGKQTGLLQGYYKTGEIRRRETYKDGKFITGNCYTRSGKDTVYYEMIARPTFPGGDQAMVKYIQNSVMFPKQARIDHIQGVVFVRFYINADGNVVDVEVVKGKGVHPLLDEEAVRCVKSMPKWTPGMVEGEAVKMVFITRIKFQLTE